MTDDGDELDLVSNLFQDMGSTGEVQQGLPAPPEEATMSELDTLADLCSAPAPNSSADAEGDDVRELANLCAELSAGQAELEDDGFSFTPSAASASRRRPGRPRGSVILRQAAADASAEQDVPADLALRERPEHRRSRSGSVPRKVGRTHWCSRALNLRLGCCPHNRACGHP